jgi:hypothetical protein
LGGESFGLWRALVWRALVCRAPFLGSWSLVPTKGLIDDLIEVGSSSGEALSWLGLAIRWKIDEIAK